MCQFSTASWKIILSLLHWYLYPLLQDFNTSSPGNHVTSVQPWCLLLESIYQAQSKCYHQDVVKHPLAHHHLMWCKTKNNLISQRSSFLQTILSHSLQTVAHPAASDLHCLKEIAMTLKRKQIQALHQVQQTLCLVCHTTLATGDSILLL